MCARGVGCKRAAGLFAALAAHRPPCILDRDTLKYARGSRVDEIVILIIDSNSVWWTRARKSKRPARKRRCTIRSVSSFSSPKACYTCSWLPAVC